MSFFVSGYTFNVDMKIDQDNNVTFSKSIKMEKDEIVKNICGDQLCDYSEDDVRSLANKYTFLDKYDKSTDLKEKTDITTSSIFIQYDYKLNKIDDHVGPGYNQFDIYNTDFSYDMFTIDGFNYKSNFEYKEKEQITDGTFKLSVPNKLDSENSTSKDNNNYEWDLILSPNISFVYKTTGNKEITGDKDYGKIKQDKFIFIGIGVVAGILVILFFVNILKKDKTLAAPEPKEEPKTIYNSELFNENASNTKPVDKTEETNTFVPLDESKHEDVISNKFMDTSFIGSVQDNNIVDTSTEEAKNDNIVEEKSEEESKIEENQEIKPEVKNSEIQDVSSLAFGGTPIEDKNVNEIK